MTSKSPTGCTWKKLIRTQSIVMKNKLSWWTKDTFNRSSKDTLNINNSQQLTPTANKTILLFLFHRLQIIRKIFHCLVWHSKDYNRILNRWNVFKITCMILMTTSIKSILSRSINIQFINQWPIHIKEIILPRIFKQTLLHQKWFLIHSLTAIVIFQPRSLFNNILS